ncbi:head-tail connector protein [Nitrospirillum bahiense]|uniref:Putative phiE125 gp8 family phage protein n=1 Tax=Nitrospirillum amazonense TaxID=28077 RepID=A0A560FC71_9PROT|nr:hypothetical protein [Nitrospirillum amazonense]TWB19203.1 putative phiE125 gp8 family phage protein [Nitrospirillum amazonense]
MLTVVTPAAHTRLTTLDAVKVELQLTGTADDSWMADLIDSASATIGRYVNRVLPREGVRETWRLSHPEPSLLLTRWPLAALTSITEAGIPLDPIQYEVDQYGAVWRLDGQDHLQAWACGKVVANYTAGYLLPEDAGRDLPEDIERAAVLLVKSAYFSRTRDPLVKSETVPGVLSTTWAVGGAGEDGALPPEVEALLCSYRMPGV